MSPSPFSPPQTLETEIALQSHDAILLRKSLQEADVRQQFLTYLSIVQLEGEPLTNNVLFWVEVQRFKVRGVGRGQGWAQGLPH